jgi:hypoxanthine phosphoribosyltransferase
MYVHMYSHGMIVDRVEKLAFDITQDYKNETLHLLCVLKGGSSFFADLCSAIRKFHDYTRSAHIPFTYDFVKVKSYEGTSSTGSVEITGCDVNKLANKHVILVEDIIDTGLTMCKLLEHLNTNVALSSLRVASLVEKRTSRSNGFKGDYVGFSIPDHFVVGYGLDYNQVYRDMLHIAVINEVPHYHDPY